MTKSAMRSTCVNEAGSFAIRASLAILDYVELDEGE